MTIINQDSRQDDNTLKQAMEEFKRSMSVYNKETGEVLKKNFGTLFSPMIEFFKDYRESTKEIAEKIDKFNLTDALTNENKQSQIGEKYSALRWGVDSDATLSDTQKAFFNNKYDELEEEEKKDAFDKSIMGKTSKKMSSEFSSGLQDMIRGYKSFSDVMEDMTASLTDYMMKQFSDAIMNSIFSQDNVSAFSGIVGSLFNLGGGGVSSAFGFVKQLFGKHHSGGVVPSGANYSLPGTQEQLALLKGGERVLSPGENVSYENQGGSSPVIFNNYNVKAWDSKDVSKYLLENKQLLHQITYEGIKNNNAHLRNIVRSA